MRTREDVESEGKMVGSEAWWAVEEKGGTKRRGGRLTRIRMTTEYAHARKRVPLPAWPWIRSA